MQMDLEFIGPGFFISLSCFVARLEGVSIRVILVLPVDSTCCKTVFSSLWQIKLQGRTFCSHGRMFVLWLYIVR